MGIFIGWTVCLLGEDAGELTQRIDLHSFGALDAPVDLGGIGIDRSIGRQLLSELQQAVVTLQEKSLRTAAKQTSAASTDVSIKDYRVRKIQTLFGTITIHVPRLINQGRVCPTNKQWGSFHARV